MERKSWQYFTSCESVSLFRFIFAIKVLWNLGTKYYSVNCNTFSMSSQIWNRIVSSIKLDKMICFTGVFVIFFAYTMIICYTPSINLDCKIQILSRKASILGSSWTIFPLMDIVSNANVTILWKLKQNCCNHPF